jgi:hypothetical protein
MSTSKPLDYTEEELAEDLRRYRAGECIHMDATRHNPHTGFPEAPLAVQRLTNRRWAPDAVYFLVHGTHKNNFRVTHSCGDPTCINPSHLVLEELPALSEFAARAYTAPDTEWESTARRMELDARALSFSGAEDNDDIGAQDEE